MSAQVMIVIDVIVVITEKMTMEVRSGDEMITVDKVECKASVLDAIRALPTDIEDITELSRGGVVGAPAVEMLLLPRQLESRALFRANPLSGTI